MTIYYSSRESERYKDSSIIYKGVIKMNGLLSFYLGMDTECQGVVTLALVMVAIAVIGTVMKLIQAYPGYRKHVASIKKAEAIERQQRDAAVKKAAEVRAAFAAYAASADKAARMSDIVRQTSNL